MAGAVGNIWRATGRSNSPFDRPRLNDAYAAARSALGVGAFEDTWTEGAALSLRDAIDVGSAIANDLGT